MPKMTYYVLWGNNEYDTADHMTLEEVINWVKDERRYDNYGHNGATIIAGYEVYSIEMGPVEKFRED